jgi:hypothetical protein
MPSNGKSTRGNKAVTERGSASVIQNIAISNATEDVRHAVKLIPSGGSIILIIKKNILPRIITIRCFEK